MSDSMSVSIKTVFDGNIHRFNLAKLSYDELEQALNSIYGKRGFSIRYQDEDGNMISLSSSRERRVGTVAPAFFFHFIFFFFVLFLARSSCCSNCMLTSTGSCLLTRERKNCQRFLTPNCHTPPRLFFQSGSASNKKLDLSESACSARLLKTAIERKKIGNRSFMC